MIELAILLTGAAAAHALAKAIRVPVIPVLLFVGMFFSLAGLINIPLDGLGEESSPFLNAVYLGLTFLVFFSGLELSPRRFARLGSSVLLVGIGQFLLVGIAGLGAGFLLGLGWIPALYVAFAVSASSTLVIIRQLKQRRQMFEPFGRLLIGVLLIQDVFIILAIVILPASLQGWETVGISLGVTLALGVVAFFLQKRGLPWLVERLGRDEESILLVVLTLLFLGIGAAYLVDLPLIVGGFLAGFALSSFPVSGVVRGLLNSLGDFFLALFFVALGAVLTINDFTIVWQASLLALLVWLITPPLVTILAEWTNLSARPSVESGLLLSQTSEFSLILCLTGLALGHIRPELFATIALTTVITMMITPLFANNRVTDFILHWHPLHRRRIRGSHPSGHILLLGFGSSGMWTVKPLLAAGHRLLVVDDDPLVIEQLGLKGLPCLRGDGSDHQLLEQAGARRAKLIIVSMRRVHEALRVLEFVGDSVPVVVRVFEEADAKQIQSKGGLPVLSSHAAADAFMSWYEKSGMIRKVQNA